MAKGAEFGRTFNPKQLQRFDVTKHGDAVTFNHFIPPPDDLVFHEVNRNNHPSTPNRTTSPEAPQLRHPLELNGRPPTPSDIYLIEARINYGRRKLIKENGEEYAPSREEITQLIHDARRRVENLSQEERVTQFKLRGESDGAERLQEIIKEEIENEKVAYTDPGLEAYVGLVGNTDEDEGMDPPDSNPSRETSPLDLLEVDGRPLDPVEQELTAFRVDYKICRLFDENGADYVPDGNVFMDVLRDAASKVIGMSLDEKAEHMRLLEQEDGKEELFAKFAQEEEQVSREEDVFSQAGQTDVEQGFEKLDESEPESLFMEYNAILHESGAARDVAERFNATQKDPEDQIIVDDETVCSVSLRWPERGEISSFFDNDGGRVSDNSVDSFVISVGYQRGDQLRYVDVGDLLDVGQYETTLHYPHAIGKESFEPVAEIAQELVREHPELIRKASAQDITNVVPFLPSREPSAEGDHQYGEGETIYENNVYYIPKKNDPPDIVA